MINETSLADTLVNQPCPLHSLLPACEYAAGAVSAGRHETGAVVDRGRSNIGGLSTQPDDVVQAAHDANQRAAVQNADIRVSVGIYGGVEKLLIKNQLFDRLLLIEIKLNWNILEHIIKIN